MTNLINQLVKPLLGSGIGTKFPMLHSAYKSFYKMTHSGNKTFEISNGLKLTVPQDAGPGLYLSIQGNYEPYETELFLNSLKNGMTVFDIGAHVGYHTILAGDKVGSKGLVLACEPSKNNIKLLSQNIKANNLENIKVIKKAVSNKKGIAKFYINTDSSGDNSLIGQSNTYTKVAVTSIDNLSKEYKTPSIIKVDVEGAESSVVDGMTKTLNNKNLKKIFMEITPNKTDSKINIINSFQKAGFKVFIILENKKKLINFSVNAFNEEVKIHKYTNILAERI